MDKQCVLFAINEMLLYFGDVMRYIVYHVHVKVIWGSFKCFSKCLQEGDETQAIYRYIVMPMQTLHNPLEFSLHDCHMICN